MVSAAAAVNEVNAADECCEACKYCLRPGVTICVCANPISEFFRGPVLEVGWCPDFELDTSAPQ